MTSAATENIGTLITVQSSEMKCCIFDFLFYPLMKEEKVFKEAARDVTIKLDILM